MKKSLNIGIIGFGFMGKVHAYSISNLKYFYSGLPFEAKLFGVCTTSREKSEEVAAEFGFSKVYDSADELIADPDIDIVDICTPNHLHYDALKKAILAGKAIYCEKPLCISYEQAKEISELASAHGTLSSIVFNNRHIYN